jgi:hypothetical protein
MALSDEGFLENLRQGDIGGLGRNVWDGARDEWLGIDDFARVGKYASEGNFLKALKSLGAGVLELGGTALMFVPGGQIAALAAKGGKAGKLAKIPNVLRPLSLEERGAAKLAGRGGAKRGLSGAPKLTDPAEMIGRQIELPKKETISKFNKLVKSMADEVGYGRGGMSGSLLRGAGQITGQLPTAQGPLARGILGGRVRAPFLSGKLGPLAMRTGVDTQIMDPFLGDVPEAGKQAVQPISTADLYALLAMANSPGAAY